MPKTMPLKMDRQLLMNLKMSLPRENMLQGHPGPAVRYGNNNITPCSLYRQAYTGTRIRGNAPDLSLW